MTDNPAPQTKPGLLPPANFLACWLGGVGMHLVVPIAQFIHWPFRLAGLIPFLLGGWITAWADQTFKRRGTTVKPHHDPSVLVSTGPFRISRHPMYLGMTMVLLGIAVLSGSVSAFLSPIVFALIMHVKFIPREEQTMQRVFGEQFTTYKGRVRTWL